MQPEHAAIEFPFAPPARTYGGPGSASELEPSWRGPVPADADELQRLRPIIYGWIEDYYDRDHLTRAGDWMLVLAPDRADLVVAALLHDMERSVPGGPKLDMATTPWDDRAYNDAHTARSAEIVPAWLADQGASAELCAAVAQPIREHEFGGSADGDLMQACDSISFLEANVGLVASWANRGICTVDKARQKLVWMGDRVRHERGREIVAAYTSRALDEFQAQLIAPER
jgi:hypothetical protein